LKKCSQKELSCTKFHGFQARWANYGFNHDIVFSNNLRLYTYVPLGMTNNVHFGCFPFLDIKSSFFIFLAPKIDSFVKHLPKIRFKNRITPFYKILYYIICTINQLFAWKKFYSHRSRNWQIYVNSVESGSNLNYRYFIVCSYFFQKSFLRYKNRFFIIDLVRFLQD
jgi:hypothetical protein